MIQRTRYILGEDFVSVNFGKILGGKCYAYVDAPIVHIGEHAYEGRFSDELISKE